MNWSKWIFCFMLTGSVFAEDPQAENYRQILEQKYDAPIQSLEVVSLGPTTKVLWFEWIDRWSASMNVIETKPDGVPLYWYDITEFPTAQSLESVKAIDLSGSRYIEVIDCTHMGNGMLYLYQIQKGAVELKLRARVIANLSVEFEPRVAKIEYIDINNDGQKDVVIDARVIAAEDLDPLDPKETKYHREFVLHRDPHAVERDRLIERKDHRVGLKALMD